MNRSIQLVNTQSLPQVTRDVYGAINGNTPSATKALYKNIVDLMGFRNGIRSLNRRGGYEARSMSIYGYDESRQLVVIQLRRVYLKREGYYRNVQKLYYLVGNDEGQLFSHLLPSSILKMKGLQQSTPQDVVRWAESKIFGVPLGKLSAIVRQGDIALIPVRSIPNGSVQNSDLEFHVGGGSHQVMLDGEHFVSPDGANYIKGLVEIVHIKAEHRAVCAEGCFRIAEGARGITPDWVDTELGD